jgi:citrate synthase
MIGLPGRPTASGLDNVVVAHTALSDVDGEQGRLVIRGHPVEDLVERGTFEEVCGLLWDGAWPSTSQRDRLRAGLAEARTAAFEMLPSLGDALGAADGMEAVRAAVGHLRSSGGERDRMRVTGAIAVFAAAWARIQAHRAPVPPRPDLGHAADCLRMLSDRDPAPASIRGLDAYWCCVVDHGLNASTFTARLVASTGSDLISAVIAALGALKGPLHGGAPGPVLEMLDAIGNVPRARPWLEFQLATGHRIMGMGHRIYRVRDPRAFALERAMSRLDERAASTERLALARAVEQEAEQLLAARHPERLLRANVEFYTAVLLEAVGIPRTLFSPMFAAARVAGWCAHVEEQRVVGRLIRPASVYIGPRPHQGAGSPVPR